MKQERSYFPDDLRAWDIERQNRRAWHDRQLERLCKRYGVPSDPSKWGKLPKKFIIPQLSLSRYLDDRAGYLAFDAIVLLHNVRWAGDTLTAEWLRTVDTLNRRALLLNVQNRPAMPVSDQRHAIEAFLDALWQAARDAERDPNKRAGKPADPQKPKTKKMSAEAKLTAVLIDNPELTNEQLAEAAGICRSGITNKRMPKFMKARALLKSGISRMPKGRIDCRTGRPEALDREPCDGDDNGDE